MQLVTQSVEAQQREERVGGRGGPGRRMQVGGGEEGEQKPKNKGLRTLNLDALEIQRCSSYGSR